ncbi:hypothetical protein BU14_0231s0018 [Porphyra umbilicalis]|uniref:TPM domain-containing protein n=1 Tax=Porphyra umbilicalis TaxID=2786 RepID=A0A1X6P464_PORUM|nr:hypothetical protein BU14_0231s0018 [Porphyra umbilicalis]|eukprot:OSX75566.1 hypothetical protein BU14_0231s0018 [Porphyra umbilicalis]
MAAFVPSPLAGSRPFAPRRSGLCSRRAAVASPLAVPARMSHGGVNETPSRMTASLRSLATTVADRAVADTKLLAATLPPAAAATAMALALLTTVTAADVARAEFPDTPPPTIFFDEANIVPAASETQIVKSLNKLAESSGLTVRFVMVRSVPYDTLPQEYADQLFQDWGLGDKDVLFVGGSKVARGGLALGADAKKLVTPEQVESIGADTFSYKAIEAQYSLAASDVINRLIPVLNGREDPGPPVIIREDVSPTFKSKKDTNEERSKYSTVVIVLLVVACLVPMLQYYWYVKDD